MTTKDETLAERLARVLSSQYRALAKREERTLATLWSQCVRADAAKVVLEILSRWLDEGPS